MKHITNSAPFCCKNDTAIDHKDSARSRSVTELGLMLRQRKKQPSYWHMRALLQRENTIEIRPWKCFLWGTLSSMGNAPTKQKSGINL